MSTQGRTTESHRGPRQGEAYGAAALTVAMRDVHFPITKQELLRRFGNHEFQWTKEGRRERIADLLNRIPRDRFENLTEITSAISDAVEQRR